VPLDTFSPVSNPSLQTTRSVKSRVNSAQFGDGYSQRSEDGLNGAPRAYQAAWDALLSTDADTIEAFFEAHKATPFLWTPPLETAQRKWIPSTWQRGYVGGTTVTLTASLSEVFDL
jgi:phage-related protein